MGCRVLLVIELMWFRVLLVFLGGRFLGARAQCWQGTSEVMGDGGLNPRP